MSVARHPIQDKACKSSAQGLSQTFTTSGRTDPALTGSVRERIVFDPTRLNDLPAVREMNMLIAYLKPEVDKVFASKPHDLPKDPKFYESIDAVIRSMPDLVKELAVKSVSAHKEIKTDLEEFVKEKLAPYVDEKVQQRNEELKTEVAELDEEVKGYRATIQNLDQQIANLEAKDSGAEFAQAKAWLRRLINANLENDMDGVCALIQQANIEGAGWLFRA